MGYNMMLLANPANPGEVFAELSPEPLGMNAIARCLVVPWTRTAPLVKSETAPGVDTAERLSRPFGTTISFRIMLQRAHDLARARRSVRQSGR